MSRFLLRLAIVGSVSATGAFVANAHEKKKSFSVRARGGAYLTPWTTPLRSENLKRLKEENFDVLIIGGGATGAGCALEAADRGLKTAMIEQEDFSSGTSSRSTKLIHGGVRYLEAAFKNLDIGQLKLVTEALEERKFMINSAPYMAHPFPIIIPLYSWWEIPYMWIGCKLYDWVAGRHHTGFPPSRYMSKAEAMYHCPMLKADGLRGAVVYYDGQHNDARMNLHIALTAAQDGAAISNYVQAIELVKVPKSQDDPEGPERVVGVKVRERFSGEEFVVRAKAVVNATGPFCDALRKMDDQSAPDLILPAGGVHIVLPDHLGPESFGLLVPRTADGRVLFFLPWEGTTLCGTTDTKSALTMRPKPTKEEVYFILQECNRLLNKKVTPEDVRAAWSGIRPLALDPQKARRGDVSTKAVSREHVLEVSDSGLVTITGGKWTTYRNMAKDTIAAAIAQFEEPVLLTKIQKDPEDVLLIGADRAGMICSRKFQAVTVALREDYNVDRDMAEHLTRNYGTRALQIAEIMRTEGYTERLHSRYPYCEAEVVFAVREDYAMTVTDVIARRLRIAYCDAEASRKVVPRVARIMAVHSGWDKCRLKAEVEDALAFLETMESPLK